MRYAICSPTQALSFWRHLLVHKEDRDRVRALLEASEREPSDKAPSGNQAIIKRRKNFIEVYVQADVATCEQRDPKGLYKKARSGEINSFTGVSPDAPFEAPEGPELTLNTGVLSVEDCVSQLVDYLNTGDYLVV